MNPSLRSLAEITQGYTIEIEKERDQPPATSLRRARILRYSHNRSFQRPQHAGLSTPATANTGIKKTISAQPKSMGFLTPSQQEPRRLKHRHQHHQHQHHQPHHQQEQRQEQRQEQQREQVPGPRPPLPRYCRSWALRGGRSWRTYRVRHSTWGLRAAPRWQ